MSYIYVQSNTPNEWMIGQRMQRMVIKNSKAPQKMEFGKNKYIFLSGNDVAFVQEKPPQPKVPERSLIESFVSAMFSNTVSLTQIATEVPVSDTLANELDVILKDFLHGVTSLPLTVEDDKDSVIISFVGETFETYHPKILESLNKIISTCEDCDCKESIKTMKQILDEIKLRKYLTLSPYYQKYIRCHTDMSECGIRHGFGQKGAIVNLTTGSLRQYLVTNMSMENVNKYYTHSGSYKLSEQEQKRLHDLFY